MNARYILLLLLAVCSGCPGGGDADDDTAFVPGDTGPFSVTWPDAGADASWTGDLSSGAPIDIDWADESDIACWPGTEDPNFDGNHVFYQLSQPADLDLWVRVIPERGVDVSLYAMQFAGGVQTPPDVVSCVTCEASADWDGDTNPGEREELFLSGYNAYDVLIAVAGANGADEGQYSLEAWLAEPDW